MHFSSVFLMCFLLLQISVKMNHAADSCSGRCGDHSSSYDCQCNTHCQTYQDCCDDYYRLCISGNSISTGELSSLAAELWAKDVNRVSSSSYRINKQTQLSSYKDKVDRSSNKFFTSLNTWQLGDTFQAFEKLLNNYVLKTGTAETVTNTERNELESFLDKVMATQVMQTTYQLLNSKGYFTTQSAFRSYVKSVWFDLYTRSSGPLDSSGFEHVFVGEVKNSAVSGFHNWLQFYYLENQGQLNYYGWIRESDPDQILLQFSNQGYIKELTSLMLGVSPEFELAMFSTCFLAKPGSSCSFNLQGNTVKIQTYVNNGGYIGSAYFNV